MHVAADDDVTFLASGAKRCIDLLERVTVLEVLSKLDAAIMRREPASQSLLLHGHGKGLVELTVSGHINQLVRELMKYGRDQLQVAVFHHRVEHRVGEMTQG